MKIKIAYLPEEQQKASNLLRLLQSFLGDSREKIRRSERNPPYIHAYLTTSRPATNGRNLDDTSSL